MIAEFLRKHYLFVLLIPIVTIGQYITLVPHLEYGLIDLDDGSIYGFKRYIENSPNILSFFIESYKELGVYAHQYYYLGILNHLFGSNIVAYHQVTHIFKMLCSIAAYPFFYVISGSGLIAFIGAIIFAFSHSAAGSLEAVATGSDYPAIFVLLIFLWIYFYIFKNQITNLKWLILVLIFFLSALVFSTERVYPIILLILIVEVFRVLKLKSRGSLIIALKRIAVLFSPIFVAIAVKPVFLGLLVPNSTRLLQSLSAGRWDYLLVPFIAFTSTFLPRNYWRFIGIVQTNNFTEYGVRLLTGPVLFLILSTGILALVLSKKPIRFLVITILVTTIGALSSYFFALGREGASVGPAFLGFYILGLSSAFFIEWLKGGDRLYIGLFLGPFVAFFFIINTWFATMDRDLIFEGVHRYLTVPTVFISLFLGNFIILLHKKIYREKLFSKILSFIPIFLLIPILYISTTEIKGYFNNSLKVGYGNYDKIYMRQQLLPYFKNLSADNPRLIYIDTYSDSVNSQFYGNTVTSGFDVWTLWFPNVNFRKELVPNFIADFDKLKSSVIEKDGKKDIFYNKIFYKPENFYAILLKDRKVYDITSQIKKDLGL